MPGLSPIHMMVIAVVAFLVLGPEKMVGAMRTVGRAWGQFQSISQKPLEHLLDLADQEPPTGQDNGTGVASPDKEHP